MAERFNPHAKILKGGDYFIDNSSQFVLTAPRVFKKTKEQQIEEATRKIIELNENIKKLDKELTEKLERAQKDADDLIAKAEREAENIIKEAEQKAFERIKSSMDEKENILNQAKEEAKKIIEQVELEKAKIIEEARVESQRIKEEAYKQGYEAGKEEGFQSGKSELMSMIERLKSIVYLTIQEREKILVHSERQILNLVLTMVRKVVKKLTSEQEDIVIENLKEALSIIRGAMRLYIHVNPEDFDYTNKYKNELMKLIEGIPEVKILEDPTVDKGGVYIETDLGEVDARIATQLEEIEEKIKFYIPMKVKAKDIESVSKNSEEISVSSDELNKTGETQ